MMVNRLPPGAKGRALAVLYRNTIFLYRFWIREFEDLVRTLFR